MLTKRPAFLVLFLALNQPHFLLNHCFADVKLPRFISDGMVLQRDSDAKIHGWASPGEKIQVEFRGKSYRVIAEQD